MTTHFVSVRPDLTLAVYEGGDPAGPPVVFLHGGSLDASTFEGQFRAAELQACRLVALDLPGHGQSAQTPGRYGVAAMRAAVRDALRALGLETALAVGHSYGGNLLLELLPELPHLRGLLALAAPLSTAADLAAAFPDLPARPLFFDAALSPAIAGAMARYALGPHATPAQVARLQAAVERCDGRSRPEFAASIVADLGDERGHVAGTAVPLAFVAGELDNTVRHPYFDTIVAPSRWGPPLHEVPGAGHTPFLENPAAFNALLLQFLAATG